MKCYICMLNSYILTYNACLSTHFHNCRDTPTSYKKTKKKSYFTAMRPHTIYSTKNSSVPQHRSVVRNEQLEALCLQTGQISFGNSHWLRFVLQGPRNESSLGWLCGSEPCDHSPQHSTAAWGQVWDGTLPPAAQTCPHAPIRLTGTATKIARWVFIRPQSTPGGLVTAWRWTQPSLQV